MDRVVGRVEPAVGAEVRCRGDRPRRGDGADHFAVTGERCLELDADFEVDLVVEIQGDVPPSPGTCWI